MILKIRLLSMSLGVMLSAECACGQQADGVEQRAFGGMGQNELIRSERATFSSAVEQAPQHGAASFCQEVSFVPRGCLFPIGGRSCKRQKETEPKELKAWKELPNRITLSGALLVHGSNPGFAVDVSYQRWLCHYLGVAGGVGFQYWYYDDYKPQWEVIDRMGRHFVRDDESEMMPNMCFYVGPVFRLPLLAFGHDKENTLFWECMPAIALTVPSQKFTYQHEVTENGRWTKTITRSVCNQGGQWVYGLVKNSLNLQCDELVFSVGYTLSDQHPYSTLKDLRFEGKNIGAAIPSLKLSHQVEIAVAYCF